MIDAIYYDGNTSRRFPATILIHKRVLLVRGEGFKRTERVSRMALSERLQHAPRILRFADGAFIEVEDQKRLDIMLVKNRFHDPAVVQWQNNWPLSLAALVLVVGLLVSIYSWGIPAAADALAQHLPAKMEKQMGDDMLAAMDHSVLGPSKLPVAMQERLRASFAALRQPRNEHTPYQLIFRTNKTGANAFALPNGMIVMTDEMVQEAESEIALMGVLSHELGHLQRRHTGRMLLKSMGVGIILNVWAGDVSGQFAAVPGVLLSRKHSREFESEADQYAIDMMAANKLPMEPLAQLFDAMAHPRPVVQAAPDEDGEDETEQAPPPEQHNYYLDTHPADAMRIAKFRAADRASGATLPAPAAPSPEPVADPAAAAAR